MQGALLAFGLAFVLANVPTIQLTTVVLHRCLTHRSLKLQPWFLAVTKFYLWVHTSIVLKEWVAVHKRHHADADGPNDPHSPRWFGFWTVQFWNVRLYNAATRDPDVIEEYTKDMPYTKWDYRFFNRAWLGLLVGSTLYLGLFASWHPIAALLGFWGSGLFYVFFQSSTINGLGHHESPIGRRNYHDKFAADSQNLYVPGLQPVLTFVLGGEENHNNHHGDPKSANFAHFPERGERDSGRRVIRVLEFLRIASEVNEPRRLNYARPTE